MYSEQYYLEDLTEHQFLVIASEAIRRHEWQFIYFNSNGICAHTNNGIFNRNSIIKIRLEADEILFECLTNGKANEANEKNYIAILIKSINELKISLNKNELNDRVNNINKYFSDDLKDLKSLTTYSFSDRLKNFGKLFIISKDYKVTPIIIYLNTAIFIVMIFSGAKFWFPSDGLVHLNWGANYRPYTLDSEYWRLLTCGFVHFGFVHLFFNMTALASIGRMLEPILGKHLFLLSYILACIGSSLLSLVMNDWAVSAGASGAIFGLFGVYFALLTTNLLAKYIRKKMLPVIAKFIVYNLSFGLLPFIDNAGHIGGLLTGIVIGYFLYLGLKNVQNKKLVHIGSTVSVLFIIGLCMFTIPKLDNPYLAYTSTLEKVRQLESEALKVHDLLKKSNSNETITFLKEVSIPKYKECKKLITEVNSLRLPENAYKRNSKMLEYIDLRIEYFLLAKSNLVAYRHYSFGWSWEKNNRIETLVKEIEVL